MVKSRTLATTLCKTGKVLVNQEKVKPSREIKLVDHITVHQKSVIKIYEVCGLIEKRTSVNLAVPNFIDHSPLPEKKISPHLNNYELPQAVRPKGEGLPTKKDRRLINESKKYKPNHDESFYL